MSRRGLLCVLVMCVLLWAAGGTSACAQWQNGGSLAGRILDGAGAPVVHARLVITESGTGTTYEIHTDGQGRFLLADVAPGKYRIEVEAAGLAPWTEGSVEVGAGAQVVLAARATAASPQVSESAGQRVSGAGHPGTRTFNAEEQLNEAAVLTARAHAATPHGNPQRWMETEMVLSKLKRERGGVSITARPEVSRAQIAEVKRVDSAESAWAAFRPTSQKRAPFDSPADRSGQVVGHPGTRPVMADVVAAEIMPAAEKVHARVRVTTAQGMVTAKIAEVPMEVTQRGDWAEFEPGSPASQQVSESASQPARKSGADRTGTRAFGAGEQVGDNSVQTSNANASLPLMGTVYEPEGVRAVPAVEVARKTQTQDKAAKLQELAEAFVPMRRSVTDTETNFVAATNREVEGGDADGLREVSGQIEAGQAGAGQSDGAGQRRRGDTFTDADALTASGESGENSRLHGEAFVEDRNKAWGSQNEFTTLTTETSDNKFVTTPYHPPDVRMQYGLELGGGIAKGRGQWFAAVDELTRNFPGTAVASDPEKFFAPLTSSQLDTLTSRLGAVGAVGQSPSAVAEQEYTQTMDELTALLGPVARSTRQTIVLPSFSWKLNARNRISVGYDLVRLDAKNGMESAPTATWGVGSFGTKTLKVDAVSAGLNTFVTPNLLNELRYAHVHDLESERADSPTAFEEQFAKNYFGAPPEVGVASGSGGFKFGTPSTLNRPAYPDELRQEAGEMLEWAHGRNQMDAGYELDYVRDRTSGLTYATGDYTYSTKEAFVADLLAPDHCDASSEGSGNYPCWSTFRQMTGPTNFAFNTAEYAGFVTDTVKVRQSLTVSLGARYDYEKLPKPNAAMANPEIPQTAVLPSEGNLSPRVGFAWEPPWSRRRTRWTTVLRGGFGVFYGRIPNATVMAALTQTGTAGAQRIYEFKSLDMGAPTFPFVFSPDSNIAMKAAPDVTYFATGFKHARAEQAQLSLEQALGRHVQLTLNYWGSYGSHLPRIVDQNIDLTNVGQITYSVDDTNHLGPLPSSYTSKFYYQRLNPNYQQMAAMESTANSRYQAAGAALVARLPRAMALTLGYRYAHAVDDNPYAQAYHGRWDVLDPADMALEHGTSNEDIRDQLRGGLVLHEPWHVKKNWLADVADGYTVEMTGSVRSGKPYTMRVSSTVPSMSCSSEEYLKAGDNCVQIPLEGVIIDSGPPISALGSGIDGAGGGNWLPTVGRNTFRYPGTYNASLRMSKRIALRGRASLMFQADVSNVLNHRNVTQIETMGYSLAGVKTRTLTGDLKYLDGSSGHAAFGTVTDTNSTRTYTDRQVELVMRLIF